MLTIRAMAEMGPWLLREIEYRDRRGDEHCERCNTAIREVWVMDLRNEAGETIDTKRIGNECGPHLEHMVEELWNRTAPMFKNAKRVLQNLLLLEELEAAYPSLPPAYYEPGWARQQRERLVSGEGLTERKRKIMSAQSTAFLRKYRENVRKKGLTPPVATDDDPSNP